MGSPKCFAFMQVTMGFMQRQVTARKSWWQVETKQGTEFLPVDLIGENPADSDAFQPYCEGIIQTWEKIQGYGARRSAPGYLDCTPWSVFETEEEAEQYLDDNFPDDENEEE
jgi:hypothetical protein